MTTAGIAPETGVLVTVTCSRCGKQKTYPDRFPPSSDPVGWWYIRMSKDGRPDPKVSPAFVLLCSAECAESVFVAAVHEFIARAADEPIETVYVPTIGCFLE